MRILATGTFDILHKGHEYFLTQASQLGEELHVIIARDATVKKIKGKNPHNSEQVRLQQVEKLNYVTKAYLGDETDPFKRVTEEIRPHIIALGYDQVAFTENLATILEKKGLKNVIIQRIDAFKPDIYKSSKLQ